MILGWHHSAVVASFGQEILSSLPQPPSCYHQTITVIHVSGIQGTAKEQPLTDAVIHVKMSVSKTVNVLVRILEMFAVKLANEGRLCHNYKITDLSIS